MPAFMDRTRRSYHYEHEVHYRHQHHERRVRAPTPEHPEPHRTQPRTSGKHYIRYSPGSDRAEWPKDELPGANTARTLEVRKVELMDISASIKGRIRKLLHHKQQYEDLRRYRNDYASTRGMASRRAAMDREKQLWRDLRVDILDLRDTFERKAKKLAADYDMFANQYRYPSRYSARRNARGCRETSEIEAEMSKISLAVRDNCDILRR